MEESYTHPSSPCTTSAAYNGDSRRHRRSASQRRKECSDESELPKPTKTPLIEDVVEVVRKRIVEDKPQPRGEPGSFIIQIFDSPLSEEIMFH